MFTTPARMIDWYDKNQCHHNDVSGHDRSNGRIFKISYGEPEKASVDLAKLTDEQLVKLVPSSNEFMSRHARRLLMERYWNFMKEGGKKWNPADDDLSDPPKAAVRAIAHWSRIHSSLNDMIKTGATTAARLRAMWALAATPPFSSGPHWENFLNDKDEWVRAWAVQLGLEWAHDLKRPAPFAEKLADCAGRDPSPVVRLYLASACQHLSIEQRLPILEKLLAHAEDATDHNLPLMYWYATEAIAAQGPAKAVPLLGKAKIPQVREFITRRMAAASQQAANK